MGLTTTKRMVAALVATPAGMATGTGTSAATVWVVAGGGGGMGNNNDDDDDDDDDDEGGGGGNDAHEPPFEGYEELNPPTKRVCFRFSHGHIVLEQFHVRQQLRGSGWGTILMGVALTFMRFVLPLSPIQIANATSEGRKFYKKIGFVKNCSDFDLVFKPKPSSRLLGLERQQGQRRAGGGLLGAGGGDRGDVGDVGDVGDGASRRNDSSSSEEDELPGGRGGRSGDDDDDIESQYG